MLASSLNEAGFQSLSWHLYGQSDHPVLNGLECHARYDDTPELPHLLVVEATGIAPPETSDLGAELDDYDRDTAVD